MLLGLFLKLGCATLPWRDCRVVIAIEWLDMISNFKVPKCVPCWDCTNTIWDDTFWQKTLLAAFCIFLRCTWIFYIKPDYVQKHSYCGC